MPADLRELLERAAATPSCLPDLDRARRRVRRTRIYTALVVALVGGGVAAVAAASRDHSQTEFVVATPAPRDLGTFSVQLPEGWFHTNEPLTGLTDPFEILTAATMPIPDPTGEYEPACDNQLPQPLVDAMSPNDALIWLLEVRDFAPQPGTEPRPGHFADAPGRQGAECPALAQPGAIARWISFADANRGFYVQILVGPEASEERRAQTYAILDSLRFDPAPVGRTLERNGISIRIPPGWETPADEDALTPNLGNPGVMLTAGTNLVSDRPEGCAHLPMESIVALGPNDAFVSIEERTDFPSAEFGPRPLTFDEDSLEDATDFDVGTCAEQLGRDPNELVLRWEGFAENGRVVYVLLAYPKSASEARRHETWAILNSLVVTAR